MHHKLNPLNALPAVWAVVKVASKDALLVVGTAAHLVVLTVDWSDDQ